MKRKYFSLEKAKQTATINIYGDITSWAWFDNEVSAANLSKQLEELGDVNEINVYINSYGGEVAEGLAIYNALKRHKAHVTTYCDGFACSIASVIFMAGDDRVMNESSLLMIHNAWTCASGNAEELRKQADDLDKITQASVKAYMAHSSLEEEEIKKLMDAETWILPEEALSYGFVTAIEKTEKAAASQNAWLQIFELIKAKQEEEKPEETDEDDQEEPETDSTDTETEEPETEEPEDDSEEEQEAEEADEETEEESEEKKEESENAVQRWGGFFNAILKN